MLISPDNSEPFEATRNTDWTAFRNLAHRGDMKGRIQILHLADDERDAELVGATLEHGQLPCEICRAYTRRGFFEALEREQIELVIADFSIPGFDGVSALKSLRDKLPAVPCIVLLKSVEEAAAREFLKFGATDFLQKDRLSKLVPTIRRVLAKAPDRAEGHQDHAQNLKAQEMQVQPQRTDKSPHSGSQTILIVEDDLALLNVIRSLLERQGYNVLTADNGREGLRVASENNPSPIQLVIADVIMPAMGGKEMADALRATNPNLKVLFISGYPEDIVSRAGVFARGVDYLPKPYTPVALINKVRDILDH